MEVKQLDKRASGQSFEVILKSPSDLSPESPILSSPPKKKDLSLEELPDYPEDKVAWEPLYGMWRAEVTVHHRDRKTACSPSLPGPVSLLLPLHTSFHMLI